MSPCTSYFYLRPNIQLGLLCHLTSFFIHLHGHLIQDVKFLATDLSFASFAHVPRQGNAVAHVLVRRVATTLNLTLWMEDVPPDIYHVVQADLNSLI